MTQQRPLGGPFTAWSTTDDVVAGMDLTGRCAVVTAGHVGLGVQTSRALAGAGATVVVASRDPHTAATAVGDLDGVTVWQLDLLDPESIRRFTERYAAWGQPLHMLINNAGIGSLELHRDFRGFEVQFATNHLGHFQLTRELLPALRAARGARVVSVSAWGHHFSDVVWDDPHFTTWYDHRAAYGQSKTANVLFSVELDRRYADDGVRGFAVHPGNIFGTDLGGSLDLDEWRAHGLIDENDHPVIDPERDLKTPEQGAATQVFAATNPLLEGLGGLYLADNDVSPIEPDAAPLITRDHQADMSSTTTAVAGYAVAEDSARRLWDISIDMLTQS